MKGKILFWLIATVVYIASMATVGITMRTILPLFAVHYLAILASWVALIYY